jgi:pimeloyl-ACP methyl ester carboxylesterase
LELHQAFATMHIGPPYIVVGQSYGGLVIRGLPARYRTEVVGAVMVDAVHEDQQVVYGGQLVVLARTRGGYPDGMSVSGEALERERRELQSDLAHLTRRGKLVYAISSGHNIHLEDPGLVIRSIREVVDMACARRQAKG